MENPRLDPAIPDIREWLSQRAKNGQPAWAVNAAEFELLRHILFKPHEAFNGKPDSSSPWYKAEIDAASLPV